ncbi:MAG: 5-formyltetrahydrofolate cyclo-ligase [Segetibacter sp.]|nr:5-formyltetrahydrofolate cyclo-ligase [Segetibacter sp.]
MTKKELRKIYRDKRLQLSPSERSKLDDLLLIQLQRLAFDEAHLVLSYWPIEKLGEMNTHVYTRYLEHAIPGLQVAFPQIDAATSEMKALLTDDDTEFVENQYGIPEPVDAHEVDATEIDIVLVPLLAFDEQGYRVGYGKGYYDRFLTKCREDVITVGFSYFEAIDKIEDANQYDVPLNYCITPGKLYEF